MYFINKVKLPISYYAFNDNWDSLDRYTRADIVMRYIDDIELELENNKYQVKQINFRSTFYNNFQELYENGYIDKKRPLTYDKTDEIDKKKKINNKIIIKSKNQLLDENRKLKEENDHLKSMNYQYETKYNDLKEKSDYILYHLNKIIKKIPEFIQNLINRLFNYNDINIRFFKQQYDPEVKKKEEKLFKKFNLFNKKEIDKAAKHINDELEESAEKFYETKKEKDDELSR